MQTIRYVFGRKFISDPKLTLRLYQVIVQRTVRNHFVYSETEGGNLMILHKCTWKIDFKGRHFILKITIWYDERGQFFSSSLSYFIMQFLVCTRRSNKEYFPFLPWDAVWISKPQTKNFIIMIYQLSTQLEFCFINARTKILYYINPFVYFGFFKVGSLNLATFYFFF